MSKRMTDRERLKLAMDQPDTIGGTDWIGWLEIVIREMNKDADHIRALETRLARVRELPRYGTQEIKDEYGDDPSVMWIAEYELEAALDNPKSAG